MEVLISALKFNQSSSSDCVLLEECPHNFCDDGYSYDYDVSSCLDIDECANATDPCPEEYFMTLVMLTSIVDFNNMEFMQL